MRTNLRFLYFVMLCLSLSCSEAVKKMEKINGVSFVASKDAIGGDQVQPIINLNANYAAIMPFGFIQELAHPEIIFNSDRQWFGETEVGAKQYIETLHKQQIKVMLKPQIWVWRGEFTGLIKMVNNEDWRALEDAYSNFILTYAKVAQETKVEIFCIGTELETFIEERPEYWSKLIVEIRTIYKGKLTYAANWNEYNRTPFWADLDYIGIDAYFPLSNSKTPTLKECKERWPTYKNELKVLSESYYKPIMFTEYGYRSVDYAAKAPWNSDRNMTEVNLKAQSNAMASLFEEIWDEDWFAGGFVWKWFHDHKNVGGETDSQFTPQNKPVENLIRDYYSNKKT